MDGVLYDSMPGHSRAWAQAMADFGMCMTPEQVYMHEGATGRDTVAMISRLERGIDPSDEEVKRIYAHKAAIFQSYPDAAIMPGSRSVVEQVCRAGLQFLIVTGSGQPALIDRVIRDFDGYITRDRMVTSFDVKRGKPNPDPYLKGLEIAGVPASKAVVVENAPLGVRAAVAAGIETIAVNTGPLDDSILLAEHPSLLLHSMEELAEKFSGLLNA